MRSANKNRLLIVALASGLTLSSSGWTVSGPDGKAAAANAIVVELVSGAVDVRASGATRTVDTGSII
jgi:hypothetical protein